MLVRCLYASRSPAPIGEAVSIRLKPDACHLFARDTGMRIEPRSGGDTGPARN